MYIYYVFASVNAAGKVTCGQFQDDMSRLVYPYEWSEEFHCLINVSGWYTPAQIRYRMKYYPCRFEWR